MFRRYYLLALLALIFVPAMVSAQVSEAGKAVDTISAADIVGTRVLSSDTVWVLDGRVLVDSGEVLIIEPGTILKGDEDQGTDAAVLVVSRGGKLYAEGTPKNPIIFTSVLDDVDNPNDIPFGELGRGLWGGVIICGYATINTTSGVGQVEGIPQGSGGDYGGNDDADNSGILRYVSIRHGGVSIGEANEINGLTLAAVGSSTIVDHIEVYHNLDDGVEWFGGTVNTTHLAVAGCGDDSYDYDEGFRGNGQFWFTIHEANAGDRGGEHDGGTDPEDGLPLAKPTIYNATYIGSGVGAPNAGKRTFAIRDNAGGFYNNSIFTEFSGTAINVEDLASGADSRERLELGDLDFNDNIWWDFADAVQDPSLGASAVPQQFVWDILFDAGSGKNNDNVDPQIANTDRTLSQLMDPRPSAAGPAGAAPAPISADFEDVNYKGAFDPNGIPWVDGWTALDFYGWLADFGPLAECECATEVDRDTVQVFNADIVAGFNAWTRDNIYILNERVFIEDGEELYIGSGTIVKGDDDQGSDASALVVTRGGNIYSEGASDCPVIYTSFLDNVDDPQDVPFGELGRGLWGGVIILGYAQINTTSGVGQVEGLPQGSGGDYGGNDDADNSGVFKYSSIRHGGVSIGEANEINGLSMGAVGSATVINHVEVYHNLDDGFEWFGGTVNTSHLAVAFCGDDSYDYDEGFRGNGQFWFTIHEANAGDRGGEHDGGTDPEDGLPLAQPVIYNATYIGSGVGAPNAGKRTFEIRDNAGGFYNNSIFTEFSGTAINVEDLASGADSRERLELGDLDFNDNIWWDFADAVQDPSSGASAVPQQFVWDILFDAGSGKNNDNVDPLLNNVSRTQNDSLDPRPDPAGPAGAGAPAPVGPFFQNVTYKGAFDPNVSTADSWLGCWSFLYCGGFLGDVDGGGGCCVLRGDFNGDGGVNVSDLTTLVDFLFRGGPAADCPDHSDMNSDGGTNVSDLTFLVDFLFRGGPAPGSC